jgi:DnaJ-class molecular chaperone
MTTSVKTRNTGSGAGIVSAAPETSAADHEVIDGPESADGERCPTCRGLGLVRGVGKNAGGRYRTLAGAQAAQEAGRAKDCPSCEGTGIAVPAPF